MPGYILLYIFFLILAFLSFAVRITTEEGFFGLIALIFVGLAFLILFNGDHQDSQRNYNQAYRDLSQQGWNITTKDVHWQDDKVDIACASFGLHKINGKFHVTTDRSQSVGGGYNVLKPSIQKKLERTCP